MSDEHVRTWVRADARWLPFQEFMIRAGGAGPVQDMQLRGVADALPTAEVLEAIAAASAIVIGPSNPVISIGPILSVPEMRQALIDSPAPIVAVSPIVGGDVVKGPTAAFMRWAGFDASTEAVAACYAGLVDGLVADEPVDGLPVLQTDTLMTDAESRRRLATETLRFAEGLAA
jgi:LPPG:FO 2-phospho-L-lactate transferase